MKTPWRTWLDADKLRAEYEEIQRLAVKYAREQAIDPVKALGRFVVVGIAGSILVGLGGVLLIVAFLRFLQEQSAFHDSLSWIPYFIVAATSIAFTGLTVWRIAAGAAKRRTP